MLNVCIPIHRFYDEIIDVFTFMQISLQEFKVISNQNVLPIHLIATHSLVKWTNVDRECACASPCCYSVVVVTRGLTAPINWPW